MRTCQALAFSTVVLIGCKAPEVEVSEGSGFGDPAEDDGASDDTGDEEPDWSEWDMATLVVHAPASASFLPLGEPSEFEATVYDAEGEPTGWTEITWSSDVDDGWAPEGDAFTDDSLDVGTHALTAQAILPNGDRLAYTVGGIMVQHEDAGTYTGQMNVDVSFEYDGTPITVSCIGASTVIVDVYGETATGDSSCTVSLQGYDLDANHVFDLAIEDGRLEGTASIDLGWTSVDFDATGQVGDGDLLAAWEGDVYGYLDIAGELDVTRISRDTGAGE